MVVIRPKLRLLPCVINSLVLNPRKRDAPEIVNINIKYLKKSSILIPSIKVFNLNIRIQNKKIDDMDEANARPKNPKLK